MSQKKIGIFGSTGSVGKNTIEIIKLYQDNLKVVFLAANENYIELAKQAKMLFPEMVAIANENHYKKLKELLQNTNIKVLSGQDAMLEVASSKCDIVMAAITGSAGLPSLVKAVESGSNIAFANKECLVLAGDLLIKLAKKNNVKLIPVDSEHNAIMQIFDYKQRDSIEKIILTASGGPFLHKTISEIKNATKKEALAHPTWKMGEKISIDSATMFNKGLEMIEAYHLFSLKPEQIDVIIHPESIIHSMVAYKNGSTLAQLANNDMKIPISIALFWPNKIDLIMANKKLDLTKISSLNFLKPDEEKFPSLKITKQVISNDIKQALILNAANEVAVNAFLNNHIKFFNIAKIVSHMLETNTIKKTNNIDELLDYDNIIRKKTEEYMMVVNSDRTYT